MPDSLSSLLERFPRQRVLLVGDAILDHYIIGTVSRTSPEAPVPVVNVERDEWLPGGAANVARNLATQDAHVVFASICGDDDAGDQLIKLLREERRIQIEFQRVRGRLTPLKTRCVAQGQQMLRIDRENPAAPTLELEDRLFDVVEKHLPKVSGVILSDYGKGLLTTSLIARISIAAKARNIPVIVDPKGTDYRRYRGVSIITPNKKEAQEASGVKITNDASLHEAARALQKIVGGDAVAITLGPGGVTVVPRRGTPINIPARAREVYDVTGAGDTFISIFALSRFAGGDFASAAELGNLAAGIVVGRAGVAAVSREELLREISGIESPRKQVGLKELVEIRKSLGRAGRKIVFTNGCFDLLNVRHIRLLEQARSLGDVLVVALNDDDSVARIKGAPRPLLSIQERVEMISALPFVDHVIVFAEDTPKAVLESIRPDILVKGDNDVEVVGREIVESYGGEIRLLNLGFGPTEEEVIQRVMAGPKSEPRRKKQQP